MLLLFVVLCHGWRVTLDVSSADCEAHTGCLYVFFPVFASTLAFQCLCIELHYTVLANVFLVGTKGVDSRG